MALVMPESELKTILDNLTAVGGRFELATCHLYQTDVTPNGDSVPGDFTEADFDGYAASGAVIWGTTFINSGGGAEIIGDTKQFTATGGVTANTIYGYYILDAAGTGLLFAEKFDQAATVDEANDAVVVVPRFSVGP